MLDAMTAALTLAALAITLMSLYAAARSQRALDIERRAAAARRATSTSWSYFGDPPAGVTFERAAWFVDDGSDGDPTWWARATMYGHDPELSARERAELSPLFERFDRIMTRAFTRLDAVAA